MTSRYPIMLSIEGKSAVVIGGGRVASRKISGLLKTGALVTVVSPSATRTIADWERQGLLKWEKRVYQPGDETLGWLVIAATDSPDVNAEIARLTEPWQLVNVVDHARLGNFYTPAQVTRGNLMVTVGTDGASPSLTRKLQAELDERFPDTYGDYVDFLSVCRDRIKKENLSPEKKRHILSSLLDPSYQTITLQQKVLNDFKGFLNQFL